MTRKGCGDSSLRFGMTGFKGNGKVELVPGGSALSRLGESALSHVSEVRERGAPSDLCLCRVERRTGVSALHLVASRYG